MKIMELPKIDLPIYWLTVPSKGEKYQFRPFLVKEEKLLLIAAESKDPNDIVQTTLQVVNNCCLEKDFDINKLPYFDIDYLFIALRAKSISETIELKFTCNNVVEDHKCGNIFPVTLDIANVAMRTVDVESKIEISGTKGMKLRYPTYAEMKQASTKQLDMEKKIVLMSKCIEYIYDQDQIYNYKDYTDQELIDFIEGLTEGTYKRLEKWLENFPSFFIAATAPCDKCGFNHSISYDKFQSFFLN
jgi:T4 bacteriophage base plate protein